MIFASADNTRKYTAHTVRLLRPQTKGDAKKAANS